MPISRRLTAGGGAVAIAAIVVPLTLLAGGRTAPVTAVHLASSPASASPGRTAKPHPALALPAVGAAGFPASIYPPPGSHKELNLVGLCPSPADLQPPGPGIRAAAPTVVSGLGHSLRSDLRLTDRVYWQQTPTNWRAGPGDPSRTVHVLYSGTLESHHQAFGPPDMSHTILTGCGSRVARDTWMIVTGQVKEPGLQGEYLLLTRRGQVLVWNMQ